ncbi:glycosyltransferase family 9 protein [Caulobacter sp. Root1472]|uniref:glycosyltransferase family 9 protein n=1 Tax=Caulobacter sp. Root1472 TaxID=1736470 RepID=UPI0006FDE768|nr:glycosyltransferase family 9 protein [Caulobacter sp. Root1472]KQZ33182.1 heptosyltransferase [Caulobacter sp. Root1472]
MTAQHPGPVLVYAPDRGIGDLMWHLPTFRAIAATTPEGQVVLVARPSSRAAEVLAVEPTIAGVIYARHFTGSLKGVREVLDFWRICREAKPRAVWILEKIGRPAQAAWLAGVPERRGFGLGHKSQERWLQGPFLPKAMRPEHRLTKLAAFEALHGLKVDSREPGLLLDPNAVAAVEARFGERPGPWLVLGVGASEPARTWPAERFAAVSQALADLFPTVFWLGGPNDAASVGPTLDAQPVAGRDVLACDLPLDQAAALIALSAGFLGNDSGPLNVAASVGRPAIGLMGTSPVPAYSRWLSRLDGGEGRIADISVDQAVSAVRTRFTQEGWANRDIRAA